MSSVQRSLQKIHKIHSHLFKNNWTLNKLENNSKLELRFEFEIEM